MLLLKKYWPYIILAIIVGIGGFLRFWDLSSVPPSIYPDEAKNANDAITTFTQNNWRIFYPENNGREGMYIWLIALAFKTFGISVFSFKIVSAIIGTLTIIATYFITKEIFLFSTRPNGAAVQARFSVFARETAGLLAAGFLATSFWHLNFSRIGFRAISVPLFLSVGLYFTLRALRRSNWLDAVIAGLIWGAGYYTYISFRFSFLIPFFILGALIIAYIIENKPRLSWRWLENAHRAVWPLIIVAATAAASLIPLLLYFASHPQDFVSRATGISVFDEPSPIAAFLKSLGVHLLALFSNGDANWRHNFPGEAQLFWPVAFLFVAGIIYSLWVMYEGIKYRNWNMTAAHATLFAWFFALILPAALTVEGIPHALRAIGLMPVVFIFAAFGFLLFVKLVFPHRHERSDFWPFGVGTALILIFLLASSQFSHYFNDWGNRQEVAGAFTTPLAQIGYYFNAVEKIEPDTQKFLIVNEGGVEVSYPREVLPENNENGTLPMSAQTTLFIQQIKHISVQNTTYITPNDLPVFVGSAATFVPLRADNEIKNRLRFLYPQGMENYIADIWVYEIGL